MRNDYHHFIKGEQVLDPSGVTVTVALYSEMLNAVTVTYQDGSQAMFAAEALTVVDSYYATEVRTPARYASGAIDLTGTAQRPWVKFTVARTAMDAAFQLTDALQQHGARPSELHGLLEDLAAGHVLTLDDGYSFRVVARQPVEATR